MLLDWYRELIWGRRLKWPRRVTLIRHALSEFNSLRPRKDADPLYQRFKELFGSNPNALVTQDLARQLLATYSLGMGDYRTPIAEGAAIEAVRTGQKLRQIRRQLPDVIFVSPYHRTHGTLQAIIEGWPELRRVEVIEDERIREREHGLMLNSNDWRIFYSLYPEQWALRQIEGPYWYRFPQGENIPDVRARNRSWISTLVREFARADVLAVTHHVTILATRANLERLDWEEYLRLDEEEKPINCGVTTYRGIPGVGRHREGKIKLVSYNERLF